MANLHLAPYADRVLADSIVANTKTSTGIIIIGTAYEKSRRRKKSAVDLDTKEVKKTVKPGNKVFFGEYVFRGIQYFRKEYQVVKESDIIDVIPKLKN